MSADGYDPHAAIDWGYRDDVCALGCDRPIKPGDRTVIREGIVSRDVPDSHLDCYYAVLKARQADLGGTVDPQ